MSDNIANDEIANIAPDGKLPEWFVKAMKKPRQEAMINVKGRQVHYFRWGKKSAPKVILLHGFLSHARVWAFIAPLLADKYDLISFDLAGMGDSGSADNYSLDNRKNEIIDFIDALDLDQKPFLIGHSYGGGVAIQMSIDNPDKIKGLIACDVLMLAPDEVEPFLKLQAQMKRGASGGRRRIYPDWQTIKGRFRLSPEQSCELPFLFNYLAKHSVKQIDEGWTWKFEPSIIQNNVEQRDWWSSNADHFASLNIPKAIIYGERSALISKKLTDYLFSKSQKQFPIIPIPQAHHHIMVDQPLALACSMDSILSGWLTQ